MSHLSSVWGTPIDWQEIIDGWAWKGGLVWGQPDRHDVVVTPGDCTQQEYEAQRALQESLNRRW